MSGIFKKDSTVKVLSVFFAIILWFVVNPVKTKTVSVPLVIKGEDTLKDKNLMLKNRNYRQRIDVVIKGNEEKINNIEGNDFEAILDFTRISSTSDKVLTIDGPRYIGKTDGIVIQDVLQKSVEVDLEKLGKGTYPVNIKITGNLKNGYKVIDYSAVPDTITLQGGDSLIKSVGDISTTVNINNVDRDVSIKKLICKVYDKKGKEIVELSRNLNVDVSIKVAKEVPLTMVVNGKPASNYTEGTRKIYPEKVLVTGPSSVLSKISELKTEPISIDNSSKNIQKASRIVLPKGVKLVDVPNEVSVSVFIEPLASKEFVLTKDIISIKSDSTNESYVSNIKTESVTVKVKGPKEILQTLKGESIKASINVTKYQEGQHKVPVQILLPEDVKLDEDCYVDIEVQKVVSTVEPYPEDTRR